MFSLFSYFQVLNTSRFALFVLSVCNTVIFKRPLSYEHLNIFQKKIRQHYYSSVSYTDSRVGLVLEELDKSGFADDTIIVFLGDHGRFDEK